MRSLVLLDVISRQTIFSAPQHSRITRLTTDPSTNTLYTVSETAQPDGTTELAVYSFEAASQNGGRTSDSPAPLLSWTPDSLSSFSSSDSPLVVSFKYLPESDSLCLVLANGDIEQIYDPSSVTGVEPRRENVGTFDLGIKAAEWSPDEELLSLITGDDQLLVMTKDFEPLSEGPLRSTSFGVDAPVNVGWGAKESQFHGSVGKTAATVAPTSASDIQPSPDDDERPRISWRGDSAFFSVSSLEPLLAQREGDQVDPSKKRRFVRVFTRVAELSSTGEPTSGLEHGLSWQPSGSIIASTQKRIVEGGGETESHHVVFFERNGLRRYDFDLREKDGKVRQLSWNADSSLLAVWIQRASGRHVVQLWNRNNYYWSLKQELSPRLSSTGEITSLVWHPENALELNLTTTNGIESFSLHWETFASSRSAPLDDGAVAIIDGSNIKLTPFRLVNIPPPMSALTLPTTRLHTTPVHLSFSNDSQAFVTIYGDGFVEVWDWPLVVELPRGKAREVAAPRLVRSFGLAAKGEGEEDGVQTKQVACVGGGESLVLAVLRATRTGSEVVLVDAKGGVEKLEIPGGAKRIVAGQEGFVLESGDGTILELPSTTTSTDFLLPSSSLSLPEFCPRLLCLPSLPLIVGLSSSGRLYASSRLLATDATSLFSTDDFLIYTTFSHEVKFIPLFRLADGGAGAVETSYTEAFGRRAGAGGDEEVGAGLSVKRAVERGSKIVTVVPSATSLVLQMPRGNLETICPRPLVLRVVRLDLDRSRYRAAFLSCRRHRIDLNILYDHSPSPFRSHLTEFVNQVHEVDYLNLFLSGLKEEDVTETMYKPLVPADKSGATVKKVDDGENKVNVVCELVLEELSKRDVFEYANTVLTAHVRKRPPNYEEALRVLVELKAKDAARAEDAVKYIIFLSDANKLFDLALGMYDFPLVLMIAQHSQKDPREYLPFLRELRTHDHFIQRFKIDDHLERFDSALRNLALAGSDRFEEALEYTKKHALFETAVIAYKDDQTRYKTVLCANAEYLSEQKKHAEAALLYSLGGQSALAMRSYQSANAWQELFTLALTAEPKRTAVEIKAMAMEVAASLKGKRRFAEAGKVLLEYARDVESAVGALVEGAAFAEAVRLTTLYSRRDLVETHIKPGMLELQSRLLDDFTELNEQVEKQVERLAELKEKRDANPALYYCFDDPMSAMDNVELQPDGASDAGTAFTRYTAMATTIGGSSMKSSRSARSKRRAGIKKAAGKKGSIYEETYLLNSLKKSLETRLSELQADVAPLLPLLISLTSAPLRAAATELQQELTSLEAFLIKSSDLVWSWREKEWSEEQKEEWRLRELGQWVEKGKPEEGTERVERPKLAKSKWRVGLLDVL